MAAKSPSLSVQSVVQWLVHGARNAPLSQEVLTELCERLNAAGLPLWRVTVFVRTLHPEIVGRRFVWHPEVGTVVTDGSFELLERRTFLDSPMVHVSNTGEALRRRLADQDCVMDYPVLHDLREEGVTDYVVAPLHFSGGEVHFSSWATRQPGGFTDAEIEVIQSLIAPLARVAEIRAWYRVAENGGRLAPYRNPHRSHQRTDRLDMELGRTAGCFQFATREQTIDNMFLAMTSSLRRRFAGLRDRAEGDNQRRRYIDEEPEGTATS